MRTNCCLFLAFGFVATCGSVRADEKADAKAVLDKAIEAHGGAEDLKKLDASTTKFKGTIHTMGMEIAFNGDIATQSHDRHRVDIEVDAGGQKFRIVSVFNKDKGWVKFNDEAKEMDKDQIQEAVEQGNAHNVANLLPLKDAGYELSLVGEEKVGTTPAMVIRVSRKNRRDVTLFFDKKTHLLLKSESRVKEEGTGQEMSQETFYSDYSEKGLKQPKKLTVKRDGKLYMEAEVSELKVDEKFDDSFFGKP